jgi:hypothetical protein
LFYTEKGECEVIKLSKKQEEIVNHVIQLEKENNCTIYFKYDNHSKKIHPVKIINIGTKKINIEQFPAICTYSIATAMENKGILIAEKISDGLSLYRLNHENI